MAFPGAQHSITGSCELFKTARLGRKFWGADASRVKHTRCRGGQNGYTGRNQYILDFTAPTYFTGTVAQNVDALATAPYFGEMIPVAWTADSDKGMGKLFTEMETGGVMLTGANAPTLGGSANAYTLTSGLNVPATPANQTEVQFKTNIGNTGASTLAVDGGTAYPLVDAGGNPLGSGYFGANQTWVAVFTSAVGSGAVTPAWRIYYPAYPGGTQIKQALDQAASDKSVASAAGLPLVAYESGQSLVDYQHQHADLDTLYTNANHDPRMGTAYTNYYNGWKALGGGMINNFADISQDSTWGCYWGALNNVWQTSSPKYNALLAYISNTSGNPSDTTPPSTPTNLAASAVASQVSLTWTASTDNVGVAGYKIYRHGTHVGTSFNPSYTDANVAASRRRYSSHRRCIRWCWKSLAAICSGIGHHTIRGSKSHWLLAF